jgi:hypothetical protein
MNEKQKDWLEEVWKIKEKIAEETEDKSFEELWKYLNNLAKVTKMELENMKVRFFRQSYQIF